MFPYPVEAHAQGSQGDAIKVTELEGHEDGRRQNEDRDDATWFWRESQGISENLGKDPRYPGKNEECQEMSRDVKRCRRLPGSPEVLYISVHSSHLLGTNAQVICRIG